MEIASRRSTSESFPPFLVFKTDQKKNDFLKKLLALYAMQYFMTKSVSLERFSESALKNQYGPLEFNIFCPNLCIVNDQIKIIMASLIRETYTEVLEGLDKYLRPKEQRLWTPTFCCILILCMCAEMVETNTDLRVVHALRDLPTSPNGLDQKGNKVSREESIEVCRQLDDSAIRSAETGFHILYSKASKLKDGSIRDHAFNPIRNGVEIVKKAKLGRHVEEFVRDIREIVEKHRKYFLYIDTGVITDLL